MHPSDSSTQRSIEDLAIDLLNDQLACTLKKARIPMSTFGTFIEVDGYDPERSLICEVYCGIDGIKAGQTKKVITDAFKMVLCEKVKQTQLQKILLFVDETVMKKFQHSKAWYCFALELYGIQTMAIQLPDSTLIALRATKKNQSR